MMATTHALAGAVLAGVSLVVAPELAPVALAAGLAGGAFPDLDLVAAHRRSLHFPVYYTLAALAAAAVAALAPTALTVAAAAFLAAAALHSASDVLGGGLEPRPWEATSDRAVYSHFHGRWLRPRRWVPYDGAPEDFLVGVSLSGAMLAVYGAPVRWLLAAVLAVSGGYALVRRRLPDLWLRVVAALPDPVVGVIPEEFLEF